MSRQVNDIDLHIARRIRAARIRLGITQTELGDKLELTFQQVQKYETGRNRITASRLYMVAQAFELPLLHFFEGLPLADAETDYVAEAGHLRTLIERSAATLDAIERNACRAASSIREEAWRKPTRPVNEAAE